MRPSRDEWFLGMAKLVSARSTCLRRAVGCVLVDGRGQVLSTGYNGVARGLPHCNETVEVRDDLEILKKLGTVRLIDSYPNACAGATAPLGQPQSSGSGCEAIHAEMNALLQCGDVEAVRTCYVTLAPCSVCTKLLMNTGCRRIVFAEDYVPEQMEVSRRLWVDKAGRDWQRGA